MRTIEQMVQQEIMCCMSSMVAIIASGENNVKGRTELAPLAVQAAELCWPIDDYEEAAIQAGWAWDEGGPHFYNSSRGGFESYDYFKPAKAADWQELCEAHGIEPYAREVFEHWAVTNWFAEKLAAKGERVDTDFAGLNVWARTTTGQQISADGVVAAIYADMMAA